MIDHCGLVWGRLHPEPSLGCHADNAIIPLDLTQLFCPCFTLSAGPPSGFTTEIVSCWGEALWRACNLTAFIHSSTGPVVHVFASRQEGPEFNPQRGYLCLTGILLLALSRYIYSIKIMDEWSYTHTTVLMYSERDHDPISQFFSSQSLFAWKFGCQGGTESF